MGKACQFANRTFSRILLRFVSPEVGCPSVRKNMTCALSVKFSALLRKKLPSIRALFMSVPERLKVRNKRKMQDIKQEIVINRVKTWN